VELVRDGKLASGRLIFDTAAMAALMPASWGDDAMPSRPWTGYGRFCPLARALDVVGERWSLVIIQELLKQPRPYGELQDRLPGIGTSVLADRLRRLERAGVVVRRPGTVGHRVCYALTPRGQELEESLRALRRWGAGFLADPAADGSAQQRFDVTYVRGIEALADGQFQLVVDDRPATLHFAAGQLRQEPGVTPGAELTVRTSSEFLDRWAAGEAGWEDGRASGDVIVEGPPGAWPRWLAATGYLLRVEPEMTDAC
jgi:DNA-binding HxlR family transcriptional regulator